MQSKLINPLLLLLMGSFVAAPAAAQSVVASGIQVVVSGYGKDGRELMAFNSSGGGTTLALLLDAGAEGKIIELLEDDCEIESIRDDAGNNLLEEARWGPFPDVSEDGRYGAIEFSTRGRPGMDGRQITAKGKVAYQTASGSVTKSITGIALQPGTPIKWEGGEAVVESFAKSEWSDEFELTLGMSESLLKRLKSVSLTDASGSTVPLDRNGYGIMGSRASVSMTVPIAVEGAVALNFETWEGLEKVSVPFDISVGVGLPAAGR